MNRSELGEALNELAERLDRQQISARVYIVGGAAMLLAYDLIEQPAISTR